MSLRIGPQEKGFTIIEIMIATTITSVILLLATTVFVHLGSDYYKGIQLSQAQNLSRNVMDNISQKLQFSSDPFASGSAGAFRSVCIGTTRYSYILNKEQGTSAGMTQHALWQDTTALGVPCKPLNISVNPPNTSTGAPAGIAGTGKDVLPDHMRVTGLCVVANGASTYNLNVWIAFGDDDLLSDSGSGISCAYTDGTSDASIHHFYCKGGAGQQYCATSELQTTVARRLY